MLLFSVWNAFLFTANLSIGDKYEDNLANIALEQAKTRKQQAEFEQYTIDLPVYQKELDAILPKAQAVNQMIDDLKAQRKALRDQLKQTPDAAQYAALDEERATLQSRVEALQTELDALQTASK